MKILFSIYHPGFVRHFIRPLRQLCDEGHSVHIAFHNQKIDAESSMRELCAGNPRISYSVNAPRRTDEWENLCRRIRNIRNYAMYSDHRYAEAHRLRANAARELDAGDLAVGERMFAIPGMRHVIDWLLHIAERAVPSDPRISAFVAKHAPDVVLVTPLVIFNSPQVDYVKTARHLGIPCALCVASWDNLTNKGQMRELPDRVIVWNEAQVEEAVALHGMPRNRVIVTGAQSFDHWFEFKPSRSREQFLRQLGLDPASELILYLCSSTSISPDEIEFMREWYRALRSSHDLRVAGAAILVRPHPMNKQPWEQLDTGTFPNLAVWPREMDGLFEDQGRTDYFDSMYHASAVVGLNTSGQIEAGIVGKPVFTLLSKDIPHTLRGTTDTVHFEHLLQVNGGLLHVARSYDEHIAHLSRAFDGDPSMVERSRRFSAAFIRPHGLARPAAPIVADAIRALASVRPRQRLIDRALLKSIARRLLQWLIARERNRLAAGRVKSPKKKATSQRGQSNNLTRQ